MEFLIKNYGTLIRNARKQRGLSSRELAQKFGGTHAQVSHVENEKVSLTLNAAFRLINALELSPEALCSASTIQAMPFFFQKNIRVRECPTNHKHLNYNDIDVLDVKGVFSSGDFAETVTEIIEFFIDDMIPEDPPAPRYLYDFIYSCLAVKDLEKRLADLPPLSTDTTIDPIDWIDFRYPRFLPLQDIRNNYLAGGALIFLDIGAYLNRARIAKNLSLKKLGDLVGLSDRGVRKLEYQTPEKLRLEDVIKLDIALNLQGEFLDFAWTVAKFYAGTYRTKSRGKIGIKPFQTFEIHGVEKTIVLARLFQHYRKEDDWLKTLRLLFDLPTKA